MSTIDLILGNRSILEDIPPVPIGTTRPASMLRKQPPKDKEPDKLRNKARQASVISSILGVSESDEESIIPSSAQPVDPFSTAQIPGMRETPKFDSAQPAEPSVSNKHGEELIPPTAALVAPDITPKIFELIDPSQVPAPPQPTNVPPPGPPTVTPMATGADGALDTIMGRNMPPSHGAQPPPVAVESFMQAINPMEIKAKAAASLVPAAAGGEPMPEHKASDGKTIWNVTRSLLG